MQSDPGRHEPTLTAIAALLDGAHRATPDQLPDVVAAAGRHLGWDVVVYLVTFEQRQLVPLTPSTGEPLTSLEVTDDGAGLAFRTIAPVTDRQQRHWVPLLDGAERIGVLRVSLLPGGADPREQTDELRWLSMLIGHLVVVTTPYGDMLSRARGANSRSVAAEVIWNLLPPLTYASKDVVIAGLVEPCEHVAGDLFDYAVEGASAQFAIFDGSGHDLHSGLLASVALATYRNHRRRGGDLVTCGQAIDAALLNHTDGEGYATGVLARLDTATGVLEYLNAGHPHPLLMRSGRVVKSLEHSGRAMFGLGTTEVSVGHEQLEPGDRVVFYTDGIVEGRAQDGTFFGLSRLAALLEDHYAWRRPAPEALRLVVQSVLDYQRAVLQDDATLMVVDWASEAGTDLLPAQ